MTIKAKLIVNMLVTTVIIVGISLASFSSLRFLHEKLSNIAGKSTPFQIATVEFQRELQGCTINLITVTTARTPQEYSLFRGESERALERVKINQNSLLKLSASDRLNVSDDLDLISNEIFAAVEARITSDSNAEKAHAVVLQQMKELSTRLKDLDVQIRNLQASHATSFAQVLKNNEQLSAKLHNLEALRDLTNDLHSAANAASTAQNASAFRIARGRIKTILRRITNNDNGTTVISSDLKALADDTHEFLQLQDAAVTNKDPDSIKWAMEALKTLSENMNTTSLLFDQALELDSSKLAIETNRQGTIFAQSNSANSILVANSELVALGHSVTGEINRLFSAGTPAELAALHSEISPLFALCAERAQQMEKLLGKLDAGNELKMLHAAMSSLHAIRSELQSAKGIVATLDKKLRAIESANISSDKLRKLVTLQAARGNERVSVAQGVQNKSIVAVNEMLSQSIPRIAGIGALAVLVGILFSFWIYRAVLIPLGVALAAVRSQQEQAKERARLAEAIAAGDLNHDIIMCDKMTFDVTPMRDDEMGKLLSEVAGMSEAQAGFDRAFAKMTVSLRTNKSEEDRRNRLKNGLFELTLILRDEQDTTVLADRSLSFIAAFIRAKVGIMYQFDTEHEILHPVATFALARTGKQNRAIRLGEGLAGQAALEKKCIRLDSVPPDYLTINSVLGKAEPQNVLLLPILYSDTLTGVLELGSFTPFSTDDTEFLHQALEGIAIALHINQARYAVNSLLEQTQQQAEELQQSNEELEERAQMLSERRSKQHTSVVPS